MSYQVNERLFIDFWPLPFLVLLVLSFYLALNIRFPEDEKLEHLEKMTNYYLPKILEEVQKNNQK